MKGDQVITDRKKVKSATPIVHTHLQDRTIKRSIFVLAAGATVGCATEYLLPVGTLNNAKCPPET